MKVALCLTGHMRCWEQVYPNTYNTIIEKYNPDIFISTWSSLGYWVSPDQDPENKGINAYSPTLNRERVTATYQPKAMSIETQIDFSEQAKKYLPFCNEIRPANILSQFYKMYHGISLMENYAVLHDIRYDLVFRMRPDLIFHHGLPTLSPDKFYTIHHRNHTGQGTGDMFFASGMEQMMMFKHFVHFYDDIIKKCGDRFCPHMIVETMAKEFDWEELQIPKMILHSPNGQYQNYERPVEDQQIQENSPEN